MKLRVKKLRVLLLTACLVSLIGCDSRSPRGDLGSAPSLESEEPFTVAVYAPAGDLEGESLNEGLWILFSAPVVDLRAPPLPSEASEIIQIDPPLSGMYRWYGSRLLAFEPEGPLSPASEYHVTVRGATASLNGQPLGEDFGFSFRTPPLELVSISPSHDNVPPEECRSITVHFNHPVDLRIIGKSLGLRAAGQRYSFRLLRPEHDPDPRIVVLAVNHELTRDTDVVVELAQGAQSARGAYPTEYGQSLSFHTLRPLALEHTEVRDWLPRVEAELVFNQPLDADTVVRGVDVLIDDYDEVAGVAVSGSAVLLMDLPVQFDSSFDVELGPDLRDIYGQYLRDAERVSLTVGPAGSYVRFRDTGYRFLEAGFPPTVAVEFQNAVSGGFRAGASGHPYQDIPVGSFTPYDMDSFAPDTRHFQFLDLSPYLDARGLGAAYAAWEFEAQPGWSYEPVRREGELRVQVTGLGLSATIASNRVLLRVASLATGQPTKGAAVAVRVRGRVIRRAATDGRGVAGFDFRPGELRTIVGDDEGTFEIELKSGRDRMVFRPLAAWAEDQSFDAALHADEPRPAIYLYTDRGLYRPGEQLFFAGIDANLKDGRIERTGGEYSIALGPEVLTGELSKSGRFSGNFTIPLQLEPDTYDLVYNRDGMEYPTIRSFRVAHSGRSTFAVGVEAPEQLGAGAEEVVATVTGAYLAGGRVRVGTYKWWWVRREVAYDPPAAPPGYSFGVGTTGHPTNLSAAQGDLPPDGVVSAPQPISDTSGGCVYDYELTATIQDIDRQAISARSTVRVFSSDLLLGGKITSHESSDDRLYFAAREEPFTLKIVAVDTRGHGYPCETVRGRVIREKWTPDLPDASWILEEEDEQNFVVDLVRSPGGSWRGSIDLATERAGSYLVEISAADAEGRNAVTRVPFYSTGSGYVLWRCWEENRIDIVPDREIYRPGQTARLLIKTPLEAGDYLVTVERESVLSERMVHLDGMAGTLDIPITEAHVPRCFVTLTACTGRSGPLPEDPDHPDLGKPRGYFGTVALGVDPSFRKLEVRIETDASIYRPGAEVRIRVRVEDGTGPVEGAEVVLVGVDRGVPDPIDYHIPNPMEFFYDPGRYPHAVSHYDSRRMLMGSTTPQIRETPGGDSDGGSGAPPGDPQVREDFHPTAVFAPDLVTGPDGVTTLSTVLPDMVTTYRLTAIVAQDDRFGIAEREVEVQNPLAIRTALPRALRQGDTARVGIVVTNLDTMIRVVDVDMEIEAGGPLEADEVSRRVTVGPGSAVEVPFDLRAVDAGTTTVGFRVRSEGLAQIMEYPLGITRPVVMETAVVLGSTQRSAEERLPIPPSFFGGPLEGLEVLLDTSPTSLAGPAVEYLESFAYDCLEQQASKLFALVLYPSETEGAGEKVRSGLEEAVAFRMDDGGYAYWGDGWFRSSDYYVSLRIAHVAALASVRGIEIPEEMRVEDLLRYLARPPVGSSPYLRAYGAYVLALFAAAPEGAADRLVQSVGGDDVLTSALEGLAHHQLGDADRVRQSFDVLERYLLVDAGSVTLASEAPRWGYYGGDLQAMALAALLYRRVQPSSDAARALAAGLVRANEDGHWGNASNAGWALLALWEYGADPGADVAYTVELGDAEPARGRLRDGDAERIFVPPSRLAVLQDGGGSSLPLVVESRGDGTLYYAAVLRTYLDPYGLAPRDQGIGLHLEVLNEQGVDVGTNLELTEVYRINLTIYTHRDRSHLAVRIPIPSGAEVVDTSLSSAVTPRDSRTPRGARAPDADQWWDRPVIRLLDDEVRVHFDSFARGRDAVSFLIRATLAGTYPTPPAQAELMYEQEVSGRTGSLRYTIR